MVGKHKTIKYYEGCPFTINIIVCDSKTCYC